MNEENKRQENFEKLKRFLNSDMRIKNTLIELAPTPKDEYDKESKIQYVDKLYQELKNIEFDFLDICKNFYGDDNIIKNKFSEIRNKLVNFNYENGDIKDLYKQNFSDMNEELIEKVKETFVGYTIFASGGIKGLTLNSKTINELLHIFHSYIMNNEKIMESMPIIDKKDNDFGYPITLYGEDTELTKSIFDNFPSDLDVGWTDIVSVENRALMMVRDRGHALTIDIDRTEEADIVRYFIPKICNKKMVEQLPGIGTITQNGASGVFEAKKEQIAEKLFDFIGKVPTDLDMHLEEDDVKDYGMENIELIQPIEQLEESEIQPEISKKEVVLNIEDARDIAMEEGENGRKISNIVNIQQKLKESLIMQRKMTNLFSKDKGEKLDEQSI